MLLGYDEEGRREPCLLVADEEGWVQSPDSDRCHNSERFVLVHHRASFTSIPADELRWSGELRVAPDPRAPVRLRLLDPAGQPIAGVGVDVLLGTLTISGGDLSQALTRGGHNLVSRSDENGLITLYGVDVRGTRSPAVRPRLPEAEAIPLAYAVPGEVLDVWIE